jgi:hypothetical protein
MRAPLNAGRFAHDTNGGTLAAKIEVAAHNVADLDRRLNQIDTAIEEAGRRGKTNAALVVVTAFPTMLNRPRGEASRKKILAGSCFGLIALEVATHLNFSLFDKWMLLIAAFCGTTYVVDGCRAKE